LYIPRAKKGKKTVFVYIPFILMTIFYPIVRNKAHALGLNGDYSYSTLHFLPNFFGNLFGYTGLFTFGEPFLTYYTFLRTTLRTNATIVLFGTIALLLTAIFLFVSQKYMRVLKGEKARVVIFSFLFIIAALLPFIGLGNISERYGYLASVGFVLLLVYCISQIVSLFAKERLRILVITFCVILLSYFYAQGIASENVQWEEAGAITHKALALFRSNYPLLPARTNLIFVNVPIRRQQAWIFPTGLKEGLWFIYRDPTFDIIQAKTVPEAKILQEIARKKLPPRSTIFLFNAKGDVSEIN